MASLSDVNARIIEYSASRVGRVWTRSMHRGYSVLLKERREIMKTERREYIKWILDTSK
jgi:hypothetical protein